jgi:hypothetical protein
MTDENATVRKHLRNAHEHLSAVARRREAAQAASAAQVGQQVWDAAQQPAAPPTEEAPGG